MTRRLVIFANGILPDDGAARELLRAGDRVVCADAGTRHARRLGLIPDLVVGDLDSLSDEDRAWLEAGSVRIVRYPHDKDQTDLELALEHGLDDDPEEIMIMAALGSRLDHTLGNIALLAGERLVDRQCSLDDGREEVRLCRTMLSIKGRPGDFVSLVPWGVEARSVQTSGLRWPLSGETLLPQRSRGISNEMTGTQAEIRLASGLLLVVHRRGRAPGPVEEV